MLTSALFLSVLKGNCVANSGGCVPSGFNARSLGLCSPCGNIMVKVRGSKCLSPLPWSFPSFYPVPLGPLTPLVALLSSPLWNFPPSATYVPEAQLYLIPPWMRLEHHDRLWQSIWESCFPEGLPWDICSEKRFAIKGVSGPFGRSFITSFFQIVN